MKTTLLKKFLPMRKLWEFLRSDLLHTILLISLIVFYLGIILVSSLPAMMPAIHRPVLETVNPKTYYRV
jgi:hypothetical protein